MSPLHFTIFNLQFSIPIPKVPSGDTSISAGSSEARATPRDPSPHSKASRQGCQPLAATSTTHPPAPRRWHPFRMLDFESTDSRRVARASLDAGLMDEMPPASNCDGSTHRRPLIFVCGRESLTDGFGFDFPPHSGQCGASFLRRFRTNVHPTPLHSVHAGHISILFAMKEATIRRVP